MSTPMFQTGLRKIAPPFGGFTPAWAWEFLLGLFFVYAAQFLRWGVLIIGRGKNHMDIPKLYPSSSSKFSIFSSR